MKRVTVLMSAYNHERYVGQAIESVLPVLPGQNCCWMGRKQIVVHFAYKTGQEWMLFCKYKCYKVVVPQQKNHGAFMIAES